MRFECNLIPGDKLTVVEGAIDGITARDCIVVKEYTHFIEVDFGAYREGINKAKIRCKAVRLGKGWIDNV